MGLLSSSSVTESIDVHWQDDLGFKLEYVRPYLWGDHDPKRTSLNVSAFNARKLSPVFTGGPFSDEVRSQKIPKHLHL
jgi:hypothetical protein